MTKIRFGSGDNWVAVDTDDIFAISYGDGKITVSRRGMDEKTCLGIATADEAERLWQAWQGDAITPEAGASETGQARNGGTRRVCIILSGKECGCKNPRLVFPWNRVKPNGGAFQAGEANDWWKANSEAINGAVVSVVTAGIPERGMDMVEKGCHASGVAPKIVILHK